MKLVDVPILESINDKNLFKCIFLAGPPAAGKSTLIKDIVDGNAGVKIIDPDVIATIMAKNRNVPRTAVYDPNMKPEFRQKKVKQVVRYVNGMLPLFIDTTATKFESTIDRFNMLDTLGYDCAMVWLGTDLQQLFANMEGRERQVPAWFVEESHEALINNYNFYRQFFGKNFFVHNNHFMTQNEKNDLDELEGLDEEHPLVGVQAARLSYLQDRMKQAAETLTNQDILETDVSAFLAAPLKNRRGNENLVYLQAHGGRYLTDGLYTLEQLEKICSSW